MVYLAIPERSTFKDRLCEACYKLWKEYPDNPRNGWLEVYSNEMKQCPVCGENHCIHRVHECKQGDIEYQDLVRKATSTLEKSFEKFYVPEALTVVVFTQNGKKITYKTRRNGRVSASRMEWSAFLKLLKVAKRNNYHRLDIFGDSADVIGHFIKFFGKIKRKNCMIPECHCTDGFACRSDNLPDLILDLAEYRNCFREININHVRRWVNLAGIIIDDLRHEEKKHPGIGRWRWC